ncbi:MAG: alpha-ketoacid dehydrogenase subunit beta [Candidatus Nanopelagicales bacterium]|jgi:pyruvate dehydrogenase E1 component beta subunit|nr:alpha-ketoacid dehydrogenase subunit beta [Candidatus Nanopelagicales bacterium]
MAVLTMAKALNAGLAAAMRDDPKVLLMGEDIGRLGGVFRITDGLQAQYGEDRVIDTPLAESGIIGTAVGLAMRGYAPVAEIQFDGFIFPAFDQITTQVARLHLRSAGALMMRIVIRVPNGGGIGAVEHHSESPEAYFAHSPGLRIVTPSNPADAFTMIRQAIAHPDPVLFFEPKRRYWDKGEVDVDAPLAPLPELFRARVVKRGRDATLLCWGPMVRTCLDAAQADTDRDLEVIDARSLAPLDMTTIIESVGRTGRLIVVHEAPVLGGVGAEIAAEVTQECFYQLEAPVLRVGGFHAPYPPSRIEEIYLPDLDRILEAVDRSMAY